MNVEVLARQIVWVMTVLTAGGACAETASGSDPWRVDIPLLTAGPRLPGDGASVLCGQGIDLSKPLSLIVAVDFALCHNPKVKQAWAAVKGRAAAFGEAKAAYLPTASASIGQLHTRTSYPDTPTASTAGTGWTVYGNLSWRLFDFGTRAANVQASSYELAAALASHDVTLQKTVAAVVVAYFDAMTADAARLGRAETVRTSRETLSAVRRREERGAAAGSDRLQALASLAKATLALTRAEGDYRKAVSVLVYAIGLPADAAVEVPHDAEPPPQEAVTALSQWLRETELRHPAIAAARAGRLAAEARAESVRAAARPAVDFTGSYYQNGYPNQGLQATRSRTANIGVTVSLPLFDGYAQTYREKGAQAQVEQSEAQFQDVMHQVLSDVVKAHADAASALANLDASQALRDSAKAALESAQRRYGAGAADILEVLSTEASVADAEQERVRCLAEWRSARLRLLAAAGSIRMNDLRRGGDDPP